MKRASAATWHANSWSGDVCEQRVEVLGERRVQRGRRVFALGRVGLGVERRQPPADRDERRVVLAAVRHARRERPSFVEPPHLDDVIDCIRSAGGCERHAVRGRDHRPGPEIHAGGEPPVEAYLLLAHRTPALRGPVVDERERDRLLELVRAVAREEDPGDVRLAHLHRFAPPAVRLRARERRGERARPPKALDVPRWPWL